MQIAIRIIIGIIILEYATHIFGWNVFLMAGSVIFCLLVWILIKLCLETKEILGTVALGGCYATGLIVILAVMAPKVPFDYDWLTGNYNVKEIVQGIGFLPMLILGGLLPSIKAMHKLIFPVILISFFLYVFISIKAPQWGEVGNSISNTLWLMWWNAANGLALVAIEVSALGYFLLGISGVMFIFFYFPRERISLVGASQLQQRELTKIGSNIDRQTRKMKSLMDEIDRQ
jgi:hypothetical protein